MGSEMCIRDRIDASDIGRFIEWKSCFVYIDDTLVYSHTFEEHLEHLQQVFATL